MTNHLPAGQPAVQGGGSYGQQYGYGQATVANGSQGVAPVHHGHGRGRGRSQQNQYYQQHSFQPNYNQSAMYSHYMNQQYGSPYGFNTAYAMPHQYAQPNMGYHAGYGYQQPPMPIYTQQPPPPQPHYHQSPSMPPYATNNAQYSQQPTMIPNTIAVPPATPAANHSSHVGSVSTIAPVAQPAEYPFDLQHYPDHMGADRQPTEPPSDQQTLPSRSVANHTVAVARPEEVAMDQQSHADKPVYGFENAYEAGQSHLAQAINGGTVDDGDSKIDRERERQDEQINGPVPTPDPSRIFSEVSHHN